MNIAYTLSMISNRGASSTTLSPTYSTVYAPSSSDWAYVHHPHVTKFMNVDGLDRYYVMYSNGRADEDAPGQRVVIKRSYNFVDWTGSLLTIGPHNGNDSEIVYTAGGFHKHGGRLYAYYAAYEYRQDVLINGIRPNGNIGFTRVKSFVVSTENGVDWTEPKELELPIIMNGPPKAISSGRLIMPGHVTFPYTDAPAGDKNWRVSGLVTAPGIGVSDGADTVEPFAAEKQWGGGAFLCEGSFFQLPGGTIRMFLRSDTAFLWVTESYDNGVTWSRPIKTDFGHDNSKFSVGKLADGRYYVVGNNGSRSNLNLWLSTDGEKFLKRYTIDSGTINPIYSGMYKGGSFAYPSVMEEAGHLHIVVSCAKETIRAYKVGIPAP